MASLRELQERFKALKAQWPVAPLRDLSMGLTDISPLFMGNWGSYGLALAKSVGWDVEDREERIILAMGWGENTLRCNSREMLSQWWEMVGSSPLLTQKAVAHGLHTGYMLPADTGKMFEHWLENGGQSHQVAQIVWDAPRAVSRPYLIPHLLQADLLGEEHWNHWAERLTKAWQAAPSDARASTFLALITASPHTRAYAQRWLECLLDGTQRTLEGVNECLAQLDNNTAWRADSELKGLLLSVPQQKTLEDKTPAASARACLRRM